MATERKTPPRPQLNVRLPSDLHLFFDQKAQEYGVYTSIIVRRGLEYLREHWDEIDLGLDRFFAEDAEDANTEARLR